MSSCGFVIMVDSYKVFINEMQFNISDCRKFKSISLASQDIVCFAKSREIPLLNLQGWISIFHVSREKVEDKYGRTN